mmetsp:Transcript_109030/g.213624  ORF Transcript_109030/g.213624 Transcript_109030/m.213624 type:complete len:81 (+) Transcript_109030:104-346(+)
MKCMVVDLPSHGEHWSVEKMEQRMDVLTEIFVVCQTVFRRVNLFCFVSNYTRSFSGRPTGNNNALLEGGCVSLDSFQWKP